MAIPSNPAGTATPPPTRPGAPREPEHAAAPRRPASSVPSIKGLRISPPGFSATLVDISASGLLAEWGVAIKTGQAVTVTFEGTFSPPSVKAHVVRSAVASMTPGGLRYHVGLAFTAPIAFEEKPSPSETGGDTGVAPAEVAGPLPPSDIENRW